MVQQSDNDTMKNIVQTYKCVFVVELGWRICSNQLVILKVLIFQYVCEWKPQKMQKKSAEVCCLKKEKQTEMFHQLITRSYK